MIPVNPRYEPGIFFGMVSGQKTEDGRQKKRIFLAKTQSLKERKNGEWKKDLEDRRQKTEVRR